jgi:hypothetical protein
LGAVVTDGTATITIGNDDTSLSVADIAVTEANSGTKLATFTAQLTKATILPVTFKYATSDGTATAGSDYVASGLVNKSIAAGSTSVTFTVTTNGDSVVEPNETVNLALSAVTGALVGDGAAVLTINDNDGTLSIADTSVSEGNSGTHLAQFTVTLAAPLPNGVTFNFSTSDGTATAGSDYVARTLVAKSIPAGQTSATFGVYVNGDTTNEPNETFTVTLTDVVGAEVSDGVAQVTILNDDVASFSAARFDAGRLVDDIDDHNGSLQLSTDEYALLLADAAHKLCARTAAATLVGVDGVENRAVLADLADAANATCAGQPRYQAVMGEKGSMGFLVELASDTNARGVQVMAAPTMDARSGVAELTVQVPGHARPLTLVLPQAVPTEAKARSAQLLALGQRVSGKLKADPEAHLVLIGGVTLNSMLDLSARDVPKVKGQALPAERILLSPALQREFDHSTVEYLPTSGKAAAAQILHVQ